MNKELVEKTQMNTLKYFDDKTEQGKISNKLKQLSLEIEIINSKQKHSAMQINKTYY